jgi:hypothetical protein
VTVTRLTGGLTPGDGGDPRTFPAIFNDAADVIDANEVAVASQGSAIAVVESTVASQGSAITALEADVDELETRGFRFVETLYFTSSGTFTKATYPWLRAIRVKCQGAGGGGTGAGTTGAGQVSGGGGGGGGAYAESFITDIAGLDASVTVTRGGGGAGGAAGNNPGSTGGASSFGSIVSANGGDGGGTGQSSIPVEAFGSGGSGGSAATGNLVFSGGGGYAFFATATNRIYPGFGGGSYLGGNQNGFVVADSGAGSSGQLYGGGGRSARNVPSDATARVGGAGGNGIVIVELYA